MATKAKFYADLGLQSELNTQVDGDLTVDGNLTVTGTTVTVNSTVTSVGDSMMELANQNTSTDLLDIGFYGNYNDGIGSESGVSEFTGLFRDASDSTWKLFDGLEAEPTTTVNTSGTNYALADLTLGDLTSSTLTAASLTYPTSDGSANQVLTTNGNGTLSFADSGALSSGTLTTTSTSATTLDSLAIASYRGAKYSISISDATGSDYQITEVHVVHDGTNASISQFGTVLQGGSELGTFTVDISGGNLRLRVASATTNSTVYKYKRIDHSV